MKHKFLFTSVCLTPLLMVAGSVQGVTLHDAMVSVLQKNPLILEIGAGTQSAEEELIQARGDFFPSVDASAVWSNKKLEFNNTTASTTHPRTYQVKVSQPLFTGGRVLSSLRGSRAGVEVSRAQKAGVVQQVLLDLVGNYMDVLRDADVLELLKNQVTILKKQLHAATIRFEQGEVTRTDVKQAEARLAEAKADHIKGKGDLMSSRAALKRVLGDVPAELTWPQTDIALPEDIEKVKNEVLVNHPEVIEALARLTESKYKVTQARSGHYPEVTANATISRNEGVFFGQNSSEFDERTISLNVSVPLFRGGKTLSSVRESISERSRFEQLYENTRRTVEEELIDAFHAHQVALGSFRSFQESLAAEEFATTGVEKEAQLGQRTVLDVLDAQQDLLEARVNVARARRDTIVTAYRLLAAMGKLDAYVVPDA